MVGSRTRGDKLAKESANKWTIFVYILSGYGPECITSFVVFRRSWIGKSVIVRVDVDGVEVV